MDVNEYFTWLKAFHVLKPIKNQKFEAALISRLQNSNCQLDLTMLCKPCPLTNKKEEEGKNTTAFMQCTCENYMHCT